LLSEGQEILVQIAKEPIAKKGARITSHIALPGRFLVYMPTVEHIGVSRKIESDNERHRLRKLIQMIRAEEDIPSGGFIVRTAGTGVSEKEIRDDVQISGENVAGYSKAMQRSQKRPASFIAIWILFSGCFATSWPTTLKRFVLIPKMSINGLLSS
jgi:ribonuclease G